MKRYPFMIGIPMALAVAALAGEAGAALTVWNATRPATNADYRTIAEAGSFSYTNAAKWLTGASPTNAPGKIVSTEDRTASNTTTTVDGVITVGEFCQRSANVDSYVIKGANGGQIVFDNGTNMANLYLHSAVTRLSSLRNGFNVDVQMNSPLSIYDAYARQDVANAGTLGGAFSGSGRLTLNLGQNDATSNLLYKFGLNVTNTYTGGTLVQWVGQQPYGASHSLNFFGVQMALKSSGAFGGGNVTLNAAGCTQTGGGNFAGRGMWLRFDARNAFAPSASLSVLSATNLAFDLNGTTQVVGGVTVDGVPLASGTYTAGTPTWLFGAGALMIIGPPVVTTASVSGVGMTNATLGAIIASDGGTNVTSWGTTWSTSLNGTNANPQAETGAKSGVFTQDRSGLMPATLYYIWGWASNGIGIAYTPAPSAFFTEPLPATGLTAAVVGPSSIRLTWTPDASASGTVVLVRDGAAVMPCRPTARCTVQALFSGPAT